MSPLHITLHVDVKDQGEAVKIAEQLSTQAIGFALGGHATMLTIDEGMDLMSDALFIERYGPSYMQVMRVLADVNRLDEDTARGLLRLYVENNDEAAASALTAAERFNIEAEAVRASEECRREVWNVMWPGSTRAETWTLSWVAARAGLGASVVHLVERSEYTFEDHLTLLGPWRAVFGEAEPS